MGKKWQVRFYSGKDGSIPVMNYLDNLSSGERTKAVAFIDLLKDKGPNLPRPYADLLEDGIHELRIKLTGTQVRVLYFFCYENIIVLTSVFEKHTDKVPKHEIKLAKESRTDFLARFTENSIRGY